MARKLFRGTRPQVLATDANEPETERQRIFVWAWTQWFERIAGPTGDVAFTPVAETEADLRRWLAQQQAGELTELNNELAETVREEFLDQTPLYPEAPELSVEEPFREQKPDEDIEHY